MVKVFPLVALALACGLVPGFASAGNLECASWQTNHPQWIWCDDFEVNTALEGDYYSVGRDGNFGVASDGAFGGSGGLKGTYTAGAEGAGGVMLSVGRNPTNTSGRGKVVNNVDFQELYWRFYMKTGNNWVGNAMKVSRATVFASPQWTQAAIGHLWEDYVGGTRLGMDPATGTIGGTVVTTKYNDFDHLRWLGLKAGTTEVYTPATRNVWFCVEVRMKLNTPGQSDGIFAFWVDGKLEAQTTNLNWRGTYADYGINTVTLENWINGGAPQAQSRYFDNFVVSKTPIGCQAAGTTPNPPTSLNVQ